MKAMRTDYRHEFKYEINANQLELLKFRLPQVMDYDANSSFEMGYVIRSLYFDDYRNSCYYDNENGIDPREKFRIRLYNGSSDVIKLECKRKERGKTLKKSCIISKEDAKNLIAGNSKEWKETMHPLLKKLFVLQQTKDMKPKVIVEYDRIPFVCEISNVRITLDLNLRASTDLKSFFNSEIVGRPIMPLGQNLLEVKYDSILPDYIYQQAQLSNLRQTAFSKYYLCRKFGGFYDNI